MVPAHVAADARALATGEVVMMTHLQHALEQLAKIQAEGAKKKLDAVRGTDARQGNKGWIDLRTHKKKEEK